MTVVKYCQTKKLIIPFNDVKLMSNDMSIIQQGLRPESKKYGFIGFKIRGIFWEYLEEKIICHMCHEFSMPSQNVSSLIIFK